MRPVPVKYTHEAGFTLIELAVVLVILGAALLMVFPDFRGAGKYAFKSDARKLASLIRELDEEATLGKVYFRAWFDPKAETIAVETSSNGADFLPDGKRREFKFRAGVDLAYITLPGFGKVIDGRTAVVFNPTFGAEPFSVRLERDGMAATLTYNPYSGRVEVVDA